MNNALEVFSSRTRNCAQSVAEGSGNPELVPDLAAAGGGRAPGGLCGALYAALKLVPPEAKAKVRAEFAAGTGSEFCREIKGKGVACAKCVSLAAELVEKYR